MSGGKNDSYHGYISNGLIGYWDGIDNVGLGDSAHNNNATQWVDLAGKNNIRSFVGGTGFENNCFVSAAVTHSAVINGYDPGYIKTVEFLIKPDGYDGQVFVILSRAYSYGYSANRWFGLRSNKTFSFANVASSSYVETPLSIHHYAGTSSSSSSFNVPFSALYLDGEPKSDLGYGMSWSATFDIGFNSVASSYSKARFYSIRLDDRELDTSEIAANYAVDKNRFNLP